MCVRACACACACGCGCGCGCVCVCVCGVRVCVCENQYLVSIENSIFNFMQNAIFVVVFCHVFSLFFQTVLRSLQNAINPLNQSQRSIPRTVNSNGGALNPAGILDFLIYFVINKQTKIRAAG